MAIISVLLIVLIYNIVYFLFWYLNLEESWYIFYSWLVWVNIVPLMFLTFLIYSCFMIIQIYKYTDWSLEIKRARRTIYIPISILVGFLPLEICIIL